MSLNDIFTFCNSCYGDRRFFEVRIVYLKSVTSGTLYADVSAVYSLHPLKSKEGKI